MIWTGNHHLKPCCWGEMSNIPSNAPPEMEREEEGGDVNTEAQKQETVYTTPLCSKGNQFSGISVDLVVAVNGMKRDERGNRKWGGATEAAFRETFP